MRLSEKEFMIEFFKSSKVWGVSLSMLGLGLITTPLLIVLTLNLGLLFSSIFLGIIFIFIGVYMLYRYEGDMW